MKISFSEHKVQTSIHRAYCSGRELLDFYRVIWVFFCVFKLFRGILDGFSSILRLSEQIYCEFKTIESSVLDHRPIAGRTNEFIWSYGSDMDQD